MHKQRQQTHEKLIFSRYKKSTNQSARSRKNGHALTLLEVVTKTTKTVVKFASVIDHIRPFFAFRKIFVQLWLCFFFAAEAVRSWDERRRFWVVPNRMLRHCLSFSKSREALFQNHLVTFRGQESQKHDILKSSEVTVSNAFLLETLQTFLPSRLNSRFSKHFKCAQVAVSTNSLVRTYNCKLDPFGRNKTDFLSTKRKTVSCLPGLRSSVFSLLRFPPGCLLLPMFASLNRSNLLYK